MSADRPGARVRVTILANADPTTSTLCRTVCEDDRFDVTCVAFSSTLTKSGTFGGGLRDIFRASGFPYFAYACFWNGTFRVKEALLLRVPGARRLFPRFFSLRVWATRRGVEIVNTPDFNAQSFLDVIARHRPAVILTRINQILKRPILDSARHGCWCLHSSPLPRYRGIAAEFHGLLNDEREVGFTVMRMDEKLDTGGIVAQNTMAIPPGTTLHNLIAANNVVCARVAMREALDALVADRVCLRPQGEEGKSYVSWPSPEHTRAFRRKGLRFITMREALAYLLQ